MEALNNDENITMLDYALALLPVDVVLGKMLILGTVYNITEPILIIAAALSVPSPFLRVSESNLETASVILQFSSLVHNTEPEVAPKRSFLQSWRSIHITECLCQVAQSQGGKGILPQMVSTDGIRGAKTL